MHVFEAFLKYRTFFQVWNFYYMIRLKHQIYYTDREPRNPSCPALV